LCSTNWAISAFVLNRAKGFTRFASANIRQKKILCKKIWKKISFSSNYARFTLVFRGIIACIMSISRLSLLFMVRGRILSHPKGDNGQFALQRATHLWWCHICVLPQ